MTKEAAPTNQFVAVRNNFVLLVIAFTNVSEWKLRFETQLQLVTSAFI
jgi:hypothetical protein